MGRRCIDSRTCGANCQDGIEKRAMASCAERACHDGRGPRWRRDALGGVACCQPKSQPGGKLASEEAT